MAISVSNGGSGSRRRNAGGAPMAEINVTPFVDVVLVLLIIFMLTAHVMETGIEVDVPTTTSVKEPTQDLPIVTVAKDGTSYLCDKPTNINELAAAIKQRYGKAKAVYLKADKETIWDVMAQVADVLGRSKLQVNLVTQPADQRSGGRK
jgi:biopolymer transport protein ExbD